ncbi:MAG TPA: FAD-dependent oxidoreductase, partial [Woeseiaceae bacterium]|nr:FAD-dependent oxidoreductase [Woeseiaceae bacterium]
IDIAVQSKLLGAEQVGIFYRRGPERMGASRYEQEFAQTKGVGIRHWAAPVRVLVDGGRRATGVLFARTSESPDGTLQLTDETFIVEADIVFKAVGQTLALELEGETPERSAGKLLVDNEGRTSVPGIWAGGDCVASGEDLTVTAVQQGKLAAISIDRHLRAETAPAGARPTIDPAAEPPRS